MKTLIALFIVLTVFVIFQQVEINELKTKDIRLSMMDLAIVDKFNLDIRKSQDDLEERIGTLEHQLDSIQWLLGRKK